MSARSMAAPQPSGRVAWPILLFFGGILLPPELSLQLGGLRLSGYRVVLILVTVPALAQLLSGRDGLRFNVFDGLIAGHCLWALIALIKWGGIGQGIESGGIYTIECFGAYLVGRVYIRSEADFAAFARTFVLVVLAMLTVTLPEALTGAHLVRDLAAAALGGPGAPFIEPRLGIDRAFGPFDHPILYGVFCAAAFSLAYFVVAQRNPFAVKGFAVCAGVVAATFLSASGGPFTALAMQLLACSWERVTLGIPGRWLILLGLFVLLYGLLDLLSNRSPIHVFVSYLTFSTQSAYNRINIFHYGSIEVGRNPFFGLGLGDWERPVWMSDSVDNFWLLTAMRYGLPAFALLAGALIALVVTVAQRRALPTRWKNARHGWAITLFGLTVVACTVHLWNALFVLFLFLIGSGVWLVDAEPSRSQTHPDTSHRDALRRVHTMAQPVTRLF